MVNSDFFALRRRGANSAARKTPINVSSKRPAAIADGRGRDANADFGHANAPGRDTRPERRHVGPPIIQLFGFVAQATKIGELYADLAKESCKPFENFVGKASVAK